MFLLIQVPLFFRRLPRPFTFHNVSINTRGDRPALWFSQTLHSTMFLLILVLLFMVFWIAQVSLHSTMFLLILSLTADGDFEIIFTFHNVSINTILCPLA